MHHKTDIFDKTVRQDRRISRDRRKSNDRRSEVERRYDFRENPQGHRKSIRLWLRSVIKARLGVDRRKYDRRLADRRDSHKSALLTQEEIAELLSP